MDFETDTGKDVLLLLRPNARVQNIETKIDTPAEQFSNLTLILKKGQSKPPKDPIGESSQILPRHERAYSNCRKPGQGGNKFFENPHRNRRWTGCGMMGPGLESCWLKPRIAEHSKEEKPKEQNQGDYIIEKKYSSSSFGDSRSTHDEYDQAGFHVIFEYDMKNEHC